MEGLIFSCYKSFALGPGAAGTNLFNIPIPPSLSQAMKKLKGVSFTVWVLQDATGIYRDITDACTAEIGGHFSPGALPGLNLDITGVLQAWGLVYVNGKNPQAEFCFDVKAQNSEVTFGILLPRGSVGFVPAVLDTVEILATLVYE